MNKSTRLIRLNIYVSKECEIEISFYNPKIHALSEPPDHIRAGGNSWVDLNYVPLAFIQNETYSAQVTGYWRDCGLLSENSETLHNAILTFLAQHR